MKKLYLGLIIPLLALALPAFADVQPIVYPGLKITSPDTPASIMALPGVCNDMSTLIDYNTPASPVFYRMNDCSGTPRLDQFFPLPAANVSGFDAAAITALTGQNISLFTNDSGYLTSSALSPYLTSATAASTYYAKPTGTTAQYLDGIGAARSFPAPASRSFAYPSRALNSCFQISATNDADFHYKIDVTGSLSLTSGTTGTTTATSYTNSGCTTGAQALADGASAQSGTLVVGLGITQVASVSLDGTTPAGKWMKITTANTVGTPTFAIRATQAETILP